MVGETEGTWQGNRRNMGEKTKETRQGKLKEHGREHKSKKAGENEGILQGEGNRHGKENFQEREK